MNLDALTAAEYLLIRERARRNLIDKPAFTEMVKQLNECPQIQERLLFEFLDLTSQALEGDRSPRGMLANAVQFEGAIGAERMPEYLERIETVASQGFKLLGKKEVRGGDWTALELTVTVAMLALRKRDPSRFDRLCDSLRRSLSTGGDGPRSKILSKVSSAPK